MTLLGSYTDALQGVLHNTMSTAIEGLTKQFRSHATTGQVWLGVRSCIIIYALLLYVEGREDGGVREVHPTVEKWG